jgi:hypothetical protein
MLALRTSISCLGDRFCRAVRLERCRLLSEYAPAFRWPMKRASQRCAALLSWARQSTAQSVCSDCARLGLSGSSSSARDFIRRSGVTHAICSYARSCRHCGEVDVVAFLKLGSPAKRTLLGRPLTAANRAGKVLGPHTFWRRKPLLSGPLRMRSLAEIAICLSERTMSEKTHRRPVVRTFASCVRRPTTRPALQPRLPHKFLELADRIFQPMVARRGLARSPAA